MLDQQLANRPSRGLAQSSKADSVGSMDRRSFLATVAGSTALIGLNPRAFFAQGTRTAPNLARIARVSSSINSSFDRVDAIKSDFVPSSSVDKSHGLFSVPSWLHEEEGDIWLQYEWDSPVDISKVEVYWGIDPAHSQANAGGWAAPKSYRFLYWNGSSFVPVSHANGLAAAADIANETSFDTVKTTRLRMELVPAEHRDVAILEWRVYPAGKAPALPPLVHAGIDRSVVGNSKTYLDGSSIWLIDDPGNRVRWSSISGPGKVHIADEGSLQTTASFSLPGSYVLALTGTGLSGQSQSTVQVRVHEAPPSERLGVVYTKRYSIDSPFWKTRARALIVNWIPRCIRYCERTDIRPNQGDGGIDNFIEAGRANRGLSHAKHKGYVFSNAWVHQTVESICIALMVDPDGDTEIIAAQKHMSATLERWIPIILDAQMSDGYLQTAYTLADRKDWPERWSAQHRGNHEGYVAGYFIESAINHYTLTDGKDLRLYNAAKKLADCWVAHIGPGKQVWFDGHQQMEQALVRFGRFVNDQEGHHRGDAYIALAKFLLDSRRGGSEYDQSHLPPGQQYEAVGHAVRATYFYSGMADIAAETGDPDYQSAVLSLWDNMVNRKYYLTGGIGSGETAEGFGPNYSLRNNAYCESCSSCGLIFFQYKLNLAYHDARYADLYEQTMYNALLGSIDLEGNSFCYTNPLVNTQRAHWHDCPCCVGNIPRTLLMLPTWTYVKSSTALYVNLFVGSRIRVGEIAGTQVEVVQKTDYPWHGELALTIHPERPSTFSVHIRIPNRSTSALYTDSPAVSGVKYLTVNGATFPLHIEKGYAVITREWKAGDQIALELPMQPQRVSADERIQADRGSVALKYGPLVYNVEAADNADIDQKLGETPIRAEWKPDLLQGVMALTGDWQDGTKLLAIPHYARMNRVGPAPEYPGGPVVDYSPGTSTGTQLASTERSRKSKSGIQSKVWI